MPQALVHVHDDIAGISRRKLRGHWVYFSTDGERITDHEEIDRLNRIGLPPAYADAWYAPKPNAHILATGIDARGRKQYRYHPEFSAERDAHKFEGCAEFGRLLPLIRGQVETDLKTRNLSRPRAIASIVRLLDSGRIRVGNEVYARSNRSFGATTLLARHAQLKGGRLTLRFKAKSGKTCEICVTDRGLVRFVKQVQDLPGQHLFQYVRDDGQIATIGSSDVNDYVRDATGADFTAKNFRTWRASALAFEWLVTQKEGGIKPMLTFVSEHLCNTPAIARKSYVHPALIEAARRGDAFLHKNRKLPRQTKWMTRYERGLLDFLAQDVD
jgi:DNA topoisomerase-1